MFVQRVSLNRTDRVESFKKEEPEQPCRVFQIEQPGSFKQNNQNLSNRTTMQGISNRTTMVFQIEHTGSFKQNNHAGYFKQNNRGLSDLLNITTCVFQLDYISKTLVQRVILWIKNPVYFNYKQETTVSIAHIHFV